MWPKLVAQLFDVLPHVSRLLPLADRFFQNKAASDEATHRSLENMGESLRSELGRVTASHDGLYRQLNEQDEKLSGIALELAAVKSSVEASNARVARVERECIQNSRVLVIVLVLNLILVGLLAYLLLRHK